MDFGLKGKVALVTAASEGLGKAAALAIAREGARVVVCSRRDEEIRKAADEIHRETGAEVLPLAADVSKASDIHSLVAFVRQKFGTIHILVNNAGGPPTGDILSMSDDEWQKGFELTLLSAVRLCRAVLPMMVEQQWGRIITITSTSAKQPISDLIVSSTFRPGILGLTKVISNKYAKNNITINTVCPGSILTNRQKELIASRSAQKNMSAEQYIAEAVKDIPAGRMGRPEEIGNVVAFLASEQASYINGANLVVDGGMVKGIH